MTTEGKLTLKDKAGYGSAAIGDAITYSFLSTFLLFYLTTVVGIKPAMAGTITVIGSVSDALMNPIMGYISDHARTRWGRRRPFMMFFSFPLLISMTLLFTAFDMEYTAKVIFCMLMVIVFWISFTGFFVPFYALGAEYTQDYDERTSLRSYSSFFNMLGTLFSMVMPMAVVEYMVKLGMTEQHAWTITAAGLGIIATASIIITAAAAKDIDTPEKCVSREETGREKLVVKKVFREYMEVLSLKPMRLLLIVSLFFLIAYTMVMSTFVYYFTYNRGADGNEMSFYLGARCVLGIAMIPLAAKLCKITDKRTAMLIILAVGSVLMVAFRFIPINGIIITIIFVLVTAATTSLYWQIVPAIFYDVCEYDEYKTGKKREGAILAMQGLTEAVASGLGAQLLGIILEIAGFDGTAEVQSQQALDWIYNCTTWVPVICLVFAGAALYAFPITKKYYNNMIKEMNERKINE